MFRLKRRPPIPPRPPEAAQLPPDASAIPLSASPSVREHRSPADDPPAPTPRIRGRRSGADDGPLGSCSFIVRSRIGTAVGKDGGRYSCHAVRALPAAQRGHVVLQATDGKQAVCVITPGTTAGIALVPPEVLPTRASVRQATVQYIGGRWQSSEGKSAPADTDTASVDTSGSASTSTSGRGGYPGVADVLPAVYGRPFSVSAMDAQRRRRGNGPVDCAYVVVGVEVDLIRKIADALGAGKLTLFVPVPIRKAEADPDRVFVDRPIAVCPAEDDGRDPARPRGVGVLMPLQPSHAGDYYRKVRDLVVASERRATTDRGGGHRAG